MSCYMEDGDEVTGRYQYLPLTRSSGVDGSGVVPDPHTLLQYLLGDRSLLRCVISGVTYLV